MFFITTGIKQHLQAPPAKKKKLAQKDDHNKDDHNPDGHDEGSHGKDNTIIYIYVFFLCFFVIRKTTANFSLTSFH